MNRTIHPKPGMSPFLWEGFPFLMVLFIFGLISAVNWDYEKKLVTVDPTGAEWTESYMGFILLATALFMAAFASVILLIVRLTQPKEGGGGYRVSSMTIVFFALILPSLFIIVFAPAGISIMESMRQVPGK